jgi:hypothetical protein
METYKDDVCIPNISARERRRRLMGGLVSLVISLVIFAVLLATGVSYWWRLAIFPFFFSTASGFFQWRDKT